MFLRHGKEDAHAVMNDFSFGWMTGGAKLDGTSMIFGEKGSAHTRARGRGSHFLGIVLALGGRGFTWAGGGHIFFFLERFFRFVVLGA